MVAEAQVLKATEAIDIDAGVRTDRRLCGIGNFDLTFIHCSQLLCHIFCAAFENICRDELLWAPGLTNWLCEVIDVELLCH